MSLIDSASLIVTPNAYKEGTLYSVIPSDGSGDLSVTRATTATRVNSAGLVELVPYNLLTYSEQFDNAAWTKSNINLTANSVVSPSGVQDADLITENTINGSHVIYRSVTGTSNTFSFYAKPNGRNWVGILSNNGNASFFNIANGTLGTIAATSTATIEDAGNGWYRCTIYNTHPTFGASIYISTGNGVTDYLGDGTSGVYIWGAQLVEGSSALPYQKTETRLNIPRLDYSNGTCPSILVEPQRTNSCLYSEDLSNAAWTKLRATITTNAITAPNGIATADKLIATAINGDHSAFQITTSGVAKSLSVYAKAGEYNYVFVGDNNLDNQGAFFNLSNGTISQNTSPYTAKIEDAGNGWYRCSVSASNWVNTPALIGLSQNGTTLTFTGDGTSGAYFWGAQIENGSYPTSYIPTTSASVTRNADVISKTGISSLIGQTEGTLFVDVDVQSGYDANNLLATLSDGTTSNIIFINRVAGKAEYYIAVSGVGQATFAMPTILSNGSHKLAVAYKANDIVFYIDGVQVHSDTSASIPTCSRINIGSYVAGGLPYNDGIKATALWKTRLTNDELERLTGVGFNTYTEMANYYNYITQ